MNTFAGTIEKPILVKKGEPIPQNTGGPGWTPKLNQNKIPKIDWDAWIYALRAACAGCLALYISFSLNLAGSHWALTTCYIVGSERQSGQILAKSAARIVGTLVGVIASFTLVKTSSGDRCGIVTTIVGLPVFRVGLFSSEPRVEKTNRKCAFH